AHVPPLQGEPDDQQGAPGGAGAVRPVPAPARLPAGRVAGPGGGTGERADGAAGGRLHRRHDRPFRARRAPAPVRSLQPALMNVFNSFRSHVLTVLEAMAAAGELPAGLDTARVTVEPPRDPAHGDVSTNA